MSDAPVLKVEGLTKHFPVSRGVIITKTVGHVRAVDDVSLEIARGETLALVGESGCGKSTTGRLILGLMQPTAGSVRFMGEEIVGLDKRAMRRLRRHLQIIFQDPYASLNPRMTVYDTLAEAIQAHRQVSSSELPERVAALMQRVGLSPRYIRKYPHEFSGGQRQRIAIARALAVEPKLIVADEPVSALDVSIQAQIINLLAKLSREMNLTLLFISHDLSVVKHISDRIAVMYLGRIVEIGPAAQVFDDPRHPYTRALVSAIPMPDPDKERARQRIILQGDPPSPMNPPGGCAFHPRCRYAIDACKQSRPELVVNGDKRVACIRVGEIG
jgi:oligopeptide transport system ATP-binding protein